MRQFDPEHIWKYRNTILVYRVLIDVLRLPAATLSWILGILGVVTGFVHLFALWFVTLICLYYHHIIKSTIAPAEANDYAVTDIQCLLLTKITDDQLDRINDQLAGMDEFYDIMNLVLTSNLLGQDFFTDISLVKSIIEVYGTDVLIEGISEIGEGAWMAVDLAKLSGERTRKLMVDICPSQVDITGLMTT